MARPVTKGPPIQLRLPIAAHNVIAGRAEANGESVPEYVVRTLVRLAESLSALSAGAKPDPPPTTPQHPGARPVRPRNVAPPKYNPGGVITPPSRSGYRRRSS